MLLLAFMSSKASASCLSRAVASMSKRPVWMHLEQTDSGIRWDFANNDGKLDVKCGLIRTLHTDHETEDRREFSHLVRKQLF